MMIANVTHAAEPVTRSGEGFGAGGVLGAGRFVGLLRAGVREGGV